MSFLFNLLHSCLYWLYTTPVGWYMNKYLLNPTPTISPHSHINPHHNIITNTSHTYSVTPIPYGQDNYAYILMDHVHHSVIIIDVGDIDPILQWLDQSPSSSSPLHILAVLTTHKHHDHSGGNFAFLQRYPNCRIIGPHGDHVPYVNHEVKGTIYQPNLLVLGNFHIHTMITHCHTNACGMYLITVPNDSTFPPCLFSGDVLFRAGVGKFFEGTADDMIHIANAIRSTTTTWPPGTLLYPGHEYALTNLQYAAYIMPDNKHVRDDLTKVSSLRDQGLATVPTLLIREWDTNPFLRLAQENDFDYSRLGFSSSSLSTKHITDPLLMTALRHGRDNFRF